MTISYDKNGNELKIIDTISNKTDIVEDYTNNETYQAIRQLVNDLPNRDKEIIMLSFGFYGDKTYTQAEIANMLFISQSSISRLVKKIVKKLGQQLQEKGFYRIKEKRRKFQTNTKTYYNKRKEKSFFCSNYRGNIKRNY